MSNTRYRAVRATSVLQTILDNNNRLWADGFIRSDGGPDVGAQAGEVHGRARAHDTATGTAPRHEPKPEAPCRRPALRQSLSPLVAVSDAPVAGSVCRPSVDFQAVIECDPQ